MFILTLLLTTVQPGVGWWCTHALHNVFRDTPPPVSVQREVRVSAARNQWVGAQIVLRPAVDERVEGVECSPLQRQGGRGTIPASAFWYAFVEYHRVGKNSTATPEEELVRKAPADFPDGLLEQEAIDLQPDQNQPIYVQWRIPDRTPAGEYRGTVTVRLRGGAIQVPVRLTVYDFAFPQRPRLKVTIWMNDGALARHHGVEYLSEGFWQVLQRTARLMRQYHQNTIWTPWSLTRAARGADGKVRYDFSQFDRWVETFLREGFEVIELHHVGGREHGQWEDKNFVAWPLRCRNESTGQDEWLPVEEWLPALQEHLREKGWLSRTLLHVADEPIEVNVDSWKQLSERVHRLAPDLRRIDAIHVPNLEGYLEVWVPQLNFLAQWYDQFRQVQARGAELWFYVAWVPQGQYPNRLIDYPLIKTRIMHWLNHLTETTGFLHWGYNFWDAPFDQQLAPGDNWIVYAGKGAPRSSLRYEAMREGIEDYEYLCLLEDSARQVAKRLNLTDFDAKAWAKGYTRLVAPGYTDYTRDPARLYTVRDAVARAIESLRQSALPVLAWQKERVGEQVTVEGVTLPGAKVSAGSTSVTADGKGRFTLRVSGVKGNLITVEAQRLRTRNRLPVVLP
ncbi:MAG: glycoside hydrolase domain-containing protein [Armatimonadota bacterium]